jgi:hypothetical protein
VALPSGSQGARSSSVWRSTVVRESAAAGPAGSVATATAITRHTTSRALAPLLAGRLVAAAVFTP